MRAPKELPFGFKIETPEGMTYIPWTDGHAVGFRCEQGGKMEFLYLNPSSESDDGQPNVFVYHGDAGDPSQDGPCNFYNVGVEVTPQ